MNGSLLNLKKLFEVFISIIIGIVLFSVIPDFIKKINRKE